MHDLLHSGPASTVNIIHSLILVKNNNNSFIHPCKPIHWACMLRTLRQVATQLYRFVCVNDLIGNA
jgi:hypothetical protein